MKFIVKGVGIGLVGAVYVWLYGLMDHHEGLFVFGSLMAVLTFASGRRGAEK